MVILIYVCIKSNLFTLELLYIVDVFGIYFVSIDVGAQVVIILLACRPCVVIVNCLGQVLYLGRAPRTKETLPDFRECRVGYPTSTSIPRVDGLSTDTLVLGSHKKNWQKVWTVMCKHGISLRNKSL